MKELDGLINNEKWKLGSRSEIPNDAKILAGILVLAIKHEHTKREIWKSRFAVREYWDKMENSLVHKNYTAKQRFARLMVGITEILGICIFSTDVSQA